MKALQSKNVLLLVLLMSLTGFGKEYFAPSDTNIGGSYSTGQDQIMSTLIILLCGLTILFLKNAYFKKISIILAPFLVLFAYCMASALWSSSSSKSFVLAALNYVDVIWAIVISKICLKYSPIKAFERFLVIWSLICISDYLISAVYKGITPNLDEVALLSFIVAFIIRQEYKHIFLPLALTFIGLAGSSVSAIFCVFIGLFVYYYQNRKVILIFLFPAIFSAVYFSYLELEKGSFLLFGKGLNVLLTGSGRLGAYETVFNSIQEANTFNLIFGHGYATDRTALLAANLTWTVDVHNNLLHVMYGLGFVGLSMFLFSCFWSLRTIVSTEANKYKFFIFLGLMSFGLTSSYFFGRPSLSGVFWMSFFLLGQQKFQTRLSGL